jgi:hypothetical protein
MNRPLNVLSILSAAVGKEGRQGARPAAARRGGGGGGGGEKGSERDQGVLVSCSSPTPASAGSRLRLCSFLATAYFPSAPHLLRRVPIVSCARTPSSSATSSSSPHRQVLTALAQVYRYTPAGVVWPLHSTIWGSTASVLRVALEAS